MNQESLHDFYENVLLPQFGIESGVKWSSTDEIGPDENVHYFSVGTNDYALIFEDSGGLGSTERFVKDNVKLKNNSFEYVEPISDTDFAPSYPIKFPTPYQYCENVTGMFTLVKM